MIIENVKSMFCKSMISIAGLLIGVILPGLSQQSNESSKLVAMSFNVRYINKKDGVNSWANRKEKVAEVITSNNVDIAGLQEPWMNQIQDLQELLPEYSWFGWGRDKGNEKGEFAPIFYKKETVKVLEKGIFWLSKTPEKAGSKDWDARFPRMVVWGHFKNNRDGKEFFFFNTHMGGEVARVEGAKVLRQKIDQMSKGLPVIVTGDFNATPDSKPYSVMVNKDYQVDLVD